MGLLKNASGKAFGEKIPKSRMLTLKTPNVAIGIKTLGSFQCWEEHRRYAVALSTGVVILTQNLKKV
jgi:hypothetical protein